MKLYLIRHGETVDNVAQLYAGVRDSALTVHGVLQAERLGRYLAALGARYSHVFASNLQRAVKTAKALLAAQPNQNEAGETTIQQLPTLREQDFGFYEGKPFYARQRDSNKTGKDNHRAQHQNDPDFRDVESKESMTKRSDKFVVEHLRPLILEDHPGQDVVVAVVSHGIILSHLWRSILGIISKQTVSLAPGLSVGTGVVTPLEYLGGWSNTGYLELDITNTTLDASFDAAPEAIGEGLRPTINSPTVCEFSEHRDGPLSPRFKMLIKTVNGKEHLKGLKRSRGVGSSEHDEGQKKIESFFKKTKVG
ncbi:MAG: hypothetical protein Q9219_005559 [cf. Caloplaca sp. 3 TL-2023]